MISDTFVVERQLLSNNVDMDCVYSDFSLKVCDDYPFEIYSDFIILDVCREQE